MKSKDLGQCKTTVERISNEQCSRIESIKWISLFLFPAFSTYHLMFARSKYESNKLISVTYFGQNYGNFNIDGPIWKICH